jgi:hypothetical protein
MAVLSECFIMSDAQCQMPNAKCQMPNAMINAMNAMNAKCRMQNVQCSMFKAKRAGAVVCGALQGDATTSFAPVCLPAALDCFLPADRLCSLPDAQAGIIHLGHG